MPLNEYDDHRRAEARRLSDEFKVPVELIEDHWDTFQQKSAARQNVYTQILDDSPHFAAWLAKQPDVPPVVQDDRPTVWTVAQLLRVVGTVARVAARAVSAPSRIWSRRETPK